MFPDRWHPDTEEQLTHRMQRLHALPLLLGAQAEVYPGHPDVSKAAREFVPVLKTSCPLQRKSKSCTWTDQKATDEGLSQLTISAQGPPVLSNYPLPMRSCWLAL